MPTSIGGKLNAFSQPPGSRGELLLHEEVRFNQPRNIITLHPFTITTVNCTPAITNIGGRPCVSLAGAGAATDGANFCLGVAGVLATAGKTLRYKWAYRSTDITNHEFAFGFGVVGTGIIASDPTDHVMVRKLLSITAPSVRSRKASGTAETLTLPTGALANDTWYDFEMVVRPDAVTAGKGVVDIYFGASVAGGATIPFLTSVAIATQIPDTVKTAPFFAWRAGSTVTTAAYVEYAGYTQEA